MTDDARFSWTVLLPVKVLAQAKSRLAVLAGDRRRELALALAGDTVAAAIACPEVAQVVVVTSDPVAGQLLSALGAVVVPDGPGPLGAGPPGHVAAGPVPAAADGLGVQEGLNAALRHGAAEAARRWPGTGLAALTADLPALRPAELAAALRAAAAAGGPAAFVPDAAGVGTTLYAARSLEEFRPRFGGASRARHAVSGATELSLADHPGLRRDVDTADDLRAALAIGAGPRTTALAVELLADV
jgi:2-phospho-L-lactate guanylyltransferase